MSRNRSKSADTHYTNTAEPIQILLIARLGLLVDLKAFTDHNLTSFIYETEQRLFTNKEALSRLLNHSDLDTMIDSSNDILNIALYLKQHAIGTERLDVLNYLINMYQYPIE